MISTVKRIAAFQFAFMAGMLTMCSTYVSYNMIFPEGKFPNFLDIGELSHMVFDLAIGFGVILGLGILTYKLFRYAFNGIKSKEIVISGMILMCLAGFVFSITMH